MTNSEDRPIQAGDWVECVRDMDAGELARGNRYEVRSVTDSAFAGQLNIELVDFPGITRHASRFKRVDGPHPVSEVEQLCQSCGQPAGYCAENCAVRPRECDSCHAPAAITECYGGNLCAYCADSTEQGHGDREHIDIVTALQMLEGQMSDGSPIPGELKARTRNEAALRREAERPRGTPAERKSLAAGHPSTWKSNEGED